MTTTPPRYCIIHPPHKWEWAAWSLLSIASISIMLAWPLLDLHISTALHAWHHGFRDKYDGSVWTWLYLSTPYFTALYLLAAALIITKRIPPYSPRIGWYLCGTMALGAGLIVNGYFKTFWGRMRPWYIDNFGGMHSYTPPLSPIGDCARNCSFMSGDVAAWSSLLAIGFLFPPTIRAHFTTAALIPIALIAFTRMHQGSHFMFDTVSALLTSYGVTLLLAWHFSRQSA